MEETFKIPSPRCRGVAQGSLAWCSATALRQKPTLPLRGRVMKLLRARRTIAVHRGNSQMLKSVAVRCASAIGSGFFSPAKAARQVLPANVKPIHYDLSLAPDIAALTYRGTVAIALDVKAPTSDITLNADGLAFERVTIDGNSTGTASFDTRLH